MQSPIIAHSPGSPLIAPLHYVGEYLISLIIYFSQLLLLNYSSLTKSTFIWSFTKLILKKKLIKEHFKMSFSIRMKFSLYLIQLPQHAIICKPILFIMEIWDAKISWSILQGLLKLEITDLFTLLNQLPRFTNRHPTYRQNYSTQFQIE